LKKALDSHVIRAWFLAAMCSGMEMIRGLKFDKILP